VSDLYPRQQTGLVVVLVGVTIAILLAITDNVPRHPNLAAWSLLVFWTGLGAGMLSGNTRTLRVPGNRRRR
jgi:hypothetical protein